MNKFSKSISILILGIFLNSCYERQTRLIIDESSMGNLVMRGDSVDIVSVNKGIKNNDIVAVNCGYNISERKRINSVYRVVAGPGDIVKIDDNDLYINEVLLLPHYVKHTNIAIQIDSSMDKMVNGKRNISFKIPTIGNKYSFPFPLAGVFISKDHIVSTKYYFLLNDDYLDKNDSRLLGLIPIDSIIGVVKEVHHKR